METLAQELTQWMGSEAVHTLQQAVNRLDFAEASRLLSGLISSTADHGAFGGNS